MRSILLAVSLAAAVSQASLANDAMPEAELYYLLGYAHAAKNQCNYIWVPEYLEMLRELQSDIDGNRNRFSAYTDGVTRYATYTREGFNPNMTKAEVKQNCEDALARVGPNGSAIQMLLAAPF